MVKAVKLADIAEKMGVSVVTVSKALSGQKGVSEELREKIRILADEMGYMPVHARQQGTGKTYTIGIVTFEYYFARLASFYWKMYQELATRAVKKNCFTMLEVISPYDENEGTAPKMITEEKVDGVIILGRPQKNYLKMLYQHKKIPMVFMDFYDEEETVSSVVSSGFYGSYRLTQYLIKNGHSRIAYVGTLMYTESITDRYLGYCKALMENGIEQRKDWVLKDRDIQDGTIGLGYHIELPTDMPTAFVCNNDITAYALIKQLEGEGYRVPEDISVVGYDDYLYPEYGDSKITTYSVDMAGMSKTAIKLLIKYMEQIPQETKLHVVSGKLIERESAGRAPYQD